MLRTGMLVSVDVAVTEDVSPAGEVKPKYTATSFTVLSDPLADDAFDS